MITLEEIKNAEAQVTYLKIRLDEAKQLANKLTTEYTKEHAKFNAGDICLFIDKTTGEQAKEQFSIITPTMKDDGTIMYICSSTKTNISMYISENNLIKID